MLLFTKEDCYVIGFLLSEKAREVPQLPVVMTSPLTAEKANCNSIFQRSKWLSFFWRPES